MIAAHALLALALGLAPVAAQAQQQASVAAQGAVLRALDRVSGDLTELEAAPGDMLSYGGLQIVLGECRYPAADPASDAYAHLTIRDATEGTALFEGWMIASSPALMALDHPRYDVWVISCRTSDGDTSTD